MGCGSSTKLAGDKTADVASGAPRASHEHFSAMLLAGDVANADVVISTPTELGSVPRRCRLWVQYSKSCRAAKW